MSELTRRNQIMEMSGCSEPFTYKYPETEELDRHVFHHVHGGVYIAEKEFRVLPKDLWLLSRKYPDVEYIMRKDGEEDGRPVRTVFFARSYTHARHDLFSFHNFIMSAQKWADSREKAILKNMNDFEVFCHNSFGVEEIENSVCDKLFYELPDKNDRYQGFQRHIVVDGLVGDMILPGIYYFGYTDQDIDECGTSDERRLEMMLRAVPRMDINSRFREKTAAIASLDGFRPTTIAAIQYLAFGEENISVLEKIMKTLEDSGSHMFLREFETTDFGSCSREVRSGESAMNRYVVEKWNKNKCHLRAALTELGKKQRRNLYYDELMELCVKYILNIDAAPAEQYHEKVTSVSTGGYSGSILYVIMPKEDGGIEKALVSYAEYGSCSFCDSLERIFSSEESEETTINDLMTLCKDLVCNIVKPYNAGWRYQEQFETIQEDYNYDNI